MKRFVLMLALALATYTAAQAATGVAVPFGPSGPIQVRRGWGAVTGTVDSTQFLVHGTTDGTASGRGRDTLNVIDLTYWNRNPFAGAGAATQEIGNLWVTFGGGGTLGDTLGVELQFSLDGTNWTAVRTLAFFNTGSAALMSIPITYDCDAHVSAATIDIGHAKYMRVIFAGDSAGKQVISSVYETHFDTRQGP